MFGLKKLRFVDIGTGLSMMLGSAGLLVASALHAAEPGCCAPPPSRPMIQGGGCCDKVYEDAAEKLRNLNVGCCAPAACAAPAAGCAPAAAVCEPSTVFNGASCGDGCGTGCGGLFGGELGEPFALIDCFTDECGNNHLKDKGWVLGGHTAWGYSNNPDGAFVGNGPFVSQKEWNAFRAEQMYLYLGKVADGSKGFDWGFRADFLYGQDGNEAQAFGNINPGHYDYLNGWDHGSFEFALPQLYAEVAYQNLSVKLGHFYTIVGYEVIPTNGNFFYSKQITFYNSEAFTHTGALATYKVNDKLSVQGGWTLGWDTGFYQYARGSNFIGGATYAVNDKTSLIYTTTFGNLGWRGNGALNSFIVSQKWTDKFSTVHQFDVLGTDLQDPTTGVPANFNNTTLVGGSGVPGDSTGLINYAFYDINSKLKAGIRNEWYKADGTSYYTCTYGVNIKPTANLVIRPEVRHMWSPGNNGNIVNPATGYNNNLFNQTVFGVDAVLTF